MPSRCPLTASLFTTLSPCLTKPIRYSYPSVGRSLSSSLPAAPKLPPTNSPALSPRWLSELKDRVATCLKTRPKAAQHDEIVSISSIVARDWKELVAGSEGFLTGPGRVGLESHTVAWGDMVSIIDEMYSKSGRSKKKAFTGLSTVTET